MMDELKEEMEEEIELLESDIGMMRYIIDEMNEYEDLKYCRIILKDTADEMESELRRMEEYNG